MEKYVPDLHPSWQGKEPSHRGFKLRRRIIRLIKDQPGIKRRQISEKLNQTRTRIVYYTEILTFHGFIDCYRDEWGIFSFYPSGYDPNSNPVEKTVDTMSSKQQRQSNGTFAPKSEDIRYC